MAPLFGDNDAGGRRDILEGRFLWVAHELLRGGSSVVLDFGCWSPEERYAIRSMAERAGAASCWSTPWWTSRSGGPGATRRWPRRPRRPSR